ncbi:MAG: hypothetical protein U0229_09380 [Anaeromyxobacter sp.]
MPLEAFAPYRLPPGSLTNVPSGGDAVEPIVGPPGVVPASVVGRALADVPAGLAAPGVSPCLAADGQAAGMGGPPRACLSSRGQREFVARAVQDAWAAGFGGVLLDRPDHGHATVLLGAGFCPDCQRDFVRHLAREYGDHFQAIDYLRVARTALVDAPGAVTFERLPYGRDFWSWRHDALERAVAAYVRSARDAARSAGAPGQTARGGAVAEKSARTFDVAVQFDAVGPSQLRLARLADGVVFPAIAPPNGTGIGLHRLLRAVMRRRPAAVQPPPGLSPAALAWLAAVAATCGVELAGQGPTPPKEVERVRALGRQLREAGRGPAQTTPFAEAVLLYSPEADLWSGGRHLQALLRAAETLALAHVQAPVVTRLSDAPKDVPIVLADPGALPPHDAKELHRRLEAGQSILSFGSAGEVDETGRAHEGALPPGKPGGVRVGAGTLAELPALAPLGGEDPPAPEDVEKALNAVLGRGKRAAGVAGRHPVLVVVDRTEDAVHAHLVSLSNEKAQGVTLFLGVKLAGGVRKARFVSADGTDVRIPMNPSGQSLSTVLPSWQGYAVLSLAP